MIETVGTEMAWIIGIIEIEIIKTQGTIEIINAEIEKRRKTNECRT